MKTVILSGGSPISFGDLLRSATPVYIEKKQTSEIDNTLNPSSYSLCREKLQGPKDQDDFYTERELKVKNIACSDAVAVFMSQVVKFAKQGDLTYEDPYANTPVYKLESNEGKTTLQFAYLLKYTKIKSNFDLHLCSDRKQFFVEAVMGAPSPCELAKDFFESAKLK